MTYLVKRHTVVHGVAWHPANNEDLVRRVVRLARELERPLATPAETRAMLGLEADPNSLCK